MVDPAELDGWVAGRRSSTASPRRPGTPTFWRQTIMSHGDELAKVPLEQVSLGGEPVDQAVLDQLRERLPARADLLDLRLLRGRRLDRGPRRPGRLPGRVARPRRPRPAADLRATPTSWSSPRRTTAPGWTARCARATGRDRGRPRADHRPARPRRDQRRWREGLGRRGPLGAAVTSRRRLGARCAAARRRWSAPWWWPTSCSTRGETADPEAVAALSRWCQDRLPEYGVPRRIKLLDAIPAKETLKSDV